VDLLRSAPEELGIGLRLLLLHVAQAAKHEPVWANRIVTQPLAKRRKFCPVVLRCVAKRQSHAVQPSDELCSLLRARR
jgi:hypothetical protein